MLMLLVVLFKKTALVLIYERGSRLDHTKREHINLINCPSPIYTMGDQTQVQRDTQHCSDQLG